MSEKEAHTFYTTCPKCGWESSTTASGQPGSLVCICGSCQQEVRLVYREQAHHPMRESLAAVQHEIWTHWMSHLFTQMKMTLGHRLVVHDPGVVERWQRQMETPYADLSEEEKESDREMADKVLATLEGK